MKFRCDRDAFSEALQIVQRGVSSRPGIPALTGVLIEAAEGGLACHVGIFFRTVTWNGRNVHIGGIGGVATRADYRRRGYASIALNAAVQTMRDHDAAQFDRRP